MECERAVAPTDNLYQLARMYSLVCGIDFRLHERSIIDFIKKCTNASLQRCALERCLKSYRLFSWKRSDRNNRQPNLLSRLAPTETETELWTKIMEIIKNNSLDSWKKFILYRNSRMKYSIQFIE